MAELDREVESLGAEIVRIGKGLAGVQRLLQIHGLNLLSAIALLAEIGNIALFETSKQLTAYAGLATSTRQSNETAWRDYEAREEAAAHDCYPSRALNGQSNKDAFDGVLSEEEAGEGFR
jgi:transposase